MNPDRHQVSASHDPGGETAHSSDDLVWSFVLNFDEAIASGSELPRLDESGLPDEEVARLRAIQDCLLLFAQARHQQGKQGQQEPSTSRPREDGEHSVDDIAEELFAGTDSGNVRPIFGHFEVLRKIGEGGAGIVYLAKDLRLHREVALKIPLPVWLLSRELSQRFVREAKVVAQLNHPQIISVYEVGEFEPVCYIASEYCAGPNLASWLAQRREPVDVHAAAESVACLCDGIHYAHTRGVLHRDIKPSNIFLAPKNESGADNDARDGDLRELSPKIGDFGLAKLMEENEDRTRSGAILGTLQYLTPEQADGRARDVSVQTDVYALGAVLYELITGGPPHQGANSAEILRRILLADVEPPRRRRPEVSADLNAVCLKALEKSPARRYATAAEFGEDLRRFLDGRPTIVRDMGAFEHTWRWINRRPSLAALITVSALALTTLIVGGLIYGERLRATTGRLEQQRDANRQLLYSRDVQLADEAWRAHQVTDAVSALSLQVPKDGEADHREFSWRLLWKQCHSQLATLSGHHEDVYSVAFSPNGRWLASGGKDHTVRLWEVASQKPTHTMSGHQDEVNRVVFVSNAAVASASDDGTVRIWDVDTGEQLAKLDAHEGPVFGLAASTDGTVLASGGQAARIRLWSMPTGAELWVGPPTSGVEEIAFTPNEKILVSGHQDSVVRYWNVSKSELTYEEESGANSPVSVASSPDLGVVAAASRTGLLCTYQRARVSKWVAGANATLHPKAIGIHALAFSPRDNTLATGTRDGLIEAWNTGRDMKAPWKYFPGHGHRVWSVAWSPDGRLLATSCAAGGIKLWNAETSSKAGRIYPRHPSRIRSIAVASDPETVLTSGDDGRVRQWSRTGRYVRRILTSQGTGTTVTSYSGNSQTAVMFGKRRQVQRVDLASGNVSLVAELPELACSLAVSGNGRLAAIGCEHTTALLLDLTSGRLLHRLKTRALDVDCLALSRDGRYLATAGVGAKIELWNTVSGRRERTLAGHANRTNCLAFSPDGATLISGGSNEQICVWSVASGRLLASLIGRPSAIDALAISPDGRTLATGTHMPAWVDLWDLQTGSKLVELESFPTPLTALAFTPDGRTLFAGSEGGELIEWSLDHQPEFPQENAHARISILERVPVDGSSSGDHNAHAVATYPCLELFRAVHQYARRSGFATGYPTFRPLEDRDDSAIEAVLVHPGHVKTISISLDGLYQRPPVLHSDYRNERELLAGLLLQGHQWSMAKGYRGALPTCSVEIGEDGAARYEFSLLFGSKFKRRRMELDSDDESQTIESLFRRVHEWAVRSGFVSGFPTTLQRRRQLTCIVILPDKAEIKEIAADDLQLSR